MPMLLLDLDDDALLKVLGAFLLNQGGCMVVWKLVNKAMLRLAKMTPGHEKSSLRAIGASMELVRMVRSWSALADLPATDQDLDRPLFKFPYEHLLRAIVSGLHMRTLYEIFLSSHPGAPTVRNKWARDTQLLTPLAQYPDNPIKIDPLLTCAIKTGSLEMVQFVAFLCDFRVGHFVALKAASLGHLDIFEWILEMNDFMENGGWYEWNYTLPFTLEGDAGPRSMSIGVDLTVVSRFEPVDWDQTRFDGLLDKAAASGGNLCIVKRCYVELERRRDRNPAEFEDEEPLWYNYSHTCLLAAQNNHPHICEWAVTQLAAQGDSSQDDIDSCLESCLNEACMYGAFKAVEFLIKRQGEAFNASELLFVVRYDFEVSRFLMETMNVPVEYGMMAGAVLRQMDSDDFSELEYIDSKGCPKEIPTNFRQGAEHVFRGHHVDAYMAAVVHEDAPFGVRIALIRWLHARGYSLEGSYAMEAAMNYDDLPMVGALMALGAPFDATFFSSGRWEEYETRADPHYQNYQVYHWARDHGYAMT